MTDTDRFGPCPTRLDNQPTPSARPWRYGHGASIEGAHWDIYAGDGIDGWLVGMVTTEADAALIVEAVNAIQPAAPAEGLDGRPICPGCAPHRIHDGSCDEPGVPGASWMCNCREDLREAIEDEAGDEGLLTTPAAMPVRPHTLDLDSPEAVERLARATFIHRTSSNVPLPKDWWERQSRAIREPFLGEAAAILAALDEHWGESSG